MFEICNTLIDNSCEELSMVEAIKACLKKENVNTVSIATGYWDLPGLALFATELREFLERKEENKLRLLIGKDPYVYYSQLAKPKYKDAVDYPGSHILIDLNELEVIPEYEDAVNLLIDFLKEDNEESKIDVRIFKKDQADENHFLHSKCYIFHGLGCGNGIVGSSNFTRQGLSLEGNLELNYLETNNMQVIGVSNGGPIKSHLTWFNQKWEVADDWNREFLLHVVLKSKIGKDIDEKRKKKLIDPQPEPAPNFTPYELYIKLLQLKFGTVIDKKLAEQIVSYLPPNIKPLNYQVEAVKRCLSIMCEHGGFMLADVVGLGKTIVGSLIIKSFIDMPDEDRERKVLVVAPPAIIGAWKETIAMFDKEHSEKIAPLISFVSTGKVRILFGLDNDADVLDEETNDDVFADDDAAADFENLEFQNYGLVMIDESHKFRNSGSQMYKSLDALIGRIGNETGLTPYVGLLSATPQNNRPEDLKNQIYLFERNRIASTLKKANGGNLETFFSRVDKEYKELIKNDGPYAQLPQEVRDEKLKSLSLEIRNCVLDDILERRTRTDVEKYYQDDIQQQGLVFPTIVGPCSLKYQMGKDLVHLFYNTMSRIAPSELDKETSSEWLGYYRYCAIDYFADPRMGEKYKGRGAADVHNVAKRLARLMQILLVKRLESSFDAFTASLFNLRTYTENMIRMWENDTIFVCPQIDVNAELNTEKKQKSFDGCLQDIRVKIQNLDADGRNAKKQNMEYRKSDFTPDYIDLLKRDYKVIDGLCRAWAKNTKDPKFDAFKQNLIPVLFNPSKNTSQKLVVFSEAIDTAKSLKTAVLEAGLKPLLITADNRKDMEAAIRENFDANFDGEKKDNYNVIITTDVLAEGINLHRANVILNYDTPWNSTRLMQRIGRVNRIGSKEPNVYVYNFMPSTQGDEEIELVKKAHTKLQSFHVLFGEDSKIFSDDEQVAHYAIREAADGGESPTEKYIHELKQFRDANPERYEQIVQTNEGWTVASGNNGKAYFLVKAPRSVSLNMEVENNATAECREINLVDMLEALRVEPDAPKATLPDNWQKLIQAAIIAYNQYFKNLNKSRSGSQREKAQNVVQLLYARTGISDKSKEILEAANKIIVLNGNVEVIRCVLDIQKRLTSNGSELIKFTAADADAAIAAKLGHVLTKVEQRQGTPEIILGTCL